MARFSDFNQLFNNAGFSAQQIQALREWSDAMTEREEVRAAVIDANFTALDTGLDAMATKLNSDSGVNDTDYAGAGTAMGTTAGAATALTGLPG